MDSVGVSSTHADESVPTATAELDETAALFYDFSPGAPGSSSPPCSAPASAESNGVPCTPSREVSTNAAGLTESSEPVLACTTADIPETIVASQGLSEDPKESDSSEDAGVPSQSNGESSTTGSKVSEQLSSEKKAEENAVEEEKTITAPTPSSQDDSKTKVSKKKGKDKAAPGKKTGPVAKAQASSAKGGAARAPSDGQLLIGFSIQQQQQAKALQEEMSSLAADASTSADAKVPKLHGALLQQASWLKDLSRDVVVLQHKLVQLQQEKEAAISEAGKAALVRGKLEVLCRELQSQNKAVLAESKQIAEGERQKREKLSDQLLSSIKDVEKRLGEQGEAQMRALEENKKLVEALHRADQQLQMQEKEKEYEGKKAAVEMRIAELKLKQQEEITAKERAEREALMQQFKQQQREQAALQKQMAEYGARFQECQEMLAKSNEVMSTFKDERTKMVSRMHKTEKDLQELRVKSNKSDAALIQMLEERNGLKKQLASAKAQKEKLESLCRTLQEERKKRMAAAESDDQVPAGVEKEEGTALIEVQKEGTAA